MIRRWFGILMLAVPYVMLGLVANDSPVRALIVLYALAATVMVML